MEAIEWRRPDKCPDNWAKIQWRYRKDGDPTDRRSFNAFKVSDHNTGLIGGWPDFGYDNVFLDWSHLEYMRVLPPTELEKENVILKQLVGNLTNELYLENNKEPELIDNRYLLHEILKAHLSGQIWVGGNSVSNPGAAQKYYNDNYKDKKVIATAAANPAIKENALQMLDRICQEKEIFLTEYEKYWTLALMNTYAMQFKKVVPMQELITHLTDQLSTAFPTDYDFGYNTAIEYARDKAVDILANYKK